MVSAFFVTSWNNGSTIIATHCNFDTEKNLATNIVSSNLQITGVLEETYIEIAKELKTFGFYL